MLFLLFRLVKCNIVLMKRFLPLFMLTGLLFGQDGLILKSGEVYNGTFIRIVDELIVFQVEGENHFTPFPINDVAIIKTSNWGELTYPFNIPRKAYSDYIRISPEEKFVMNGILCAAGLWLLPRLFIYLVMRSIQYNN